MLSDSTLKDLNVIFSRNFVPGSTVSMDEIQASIATDCGVHLCMPVLPSESTVDFAEICGIGSPLFESVSDSLDEMPLAA